MGGLGNQLFQYSAGRMLSIKTGKPLVVDLSFLKHLSGERNGYTQRDYALDVFTLETELTDSFERGAYCRFIQEPDNYQLMPELLYPKRNLDSIHLSGYFQKAVYVEKIREILRKDFQFRYDYDEDGRSLAQRIRECNSVCVHIRRTDYIANEAALGFHGFIGEDHVRSGYDRLKNSLQEPRYFVFSDDISWCESNLSFLDSATFVPLSLSGFKSSQHLRLMSECRHFIISNSTFSWWGAWLSTHPGKRVLYPAKWFQDDGMNTLGMFPATWTAISS
jgi:hypothetical protein